MTQTAYPDSVQFLYSLGNELKIGAKWGLENMRALLEALGHPEHGQRFVHVAGTNGKGSTCAMVASVLRQAGLRTGLYTSPHLVEPTERIAVNGYAITAGEFVESFDRVHAAADRFENHPSYFETVTAMALLVFRERCDVSVIEVGLGGRLDATNVIDPEVCAITPVSFDHESFLGGTIEEIAWEKAGILKPGVPVVMAGQTAAGERVITERARELGCPLSRANGTLIQNRADVYGSKFSIDGIEYECPLPGRHQIENAVTAILVSRTMGIDTAAIQEGLKRAVWPGRLEFISRRPDFALDGAHNPAGAKALAAYIREFWAAKPVWIVYGAMRDKAIDEVTSEIFPLAERVILTAPDFPRALRPEAILEVTMHANATIAPTIAEAISVAREAPEDGVVFFTGSLFVVGEARKLL